MSDEKPRMRLGPRARAEFGRQELLPLVRATRAGMGVVVGDGRKPVAEGFTLVALPAHEKRGQVVDDASGTIRQSRATFAHERGECPLRAVLADACGVQTVEALFEPELRADAIRHRPRERVQIELFCVATDCGVRSVVRESCRHHGRKRIVTNDAVGTACTHHRRRQVKRVQEVEEPVKLASTRDENAARILREFNR